MRVHTPNIELGYHRKTDTRIHFANLFDLAFHAWLLATTIVRQCTRPNEFSIFALIPDVLVRSVLLRDPVEGGRASDEKDLAVIVGQQD